MIDLTALQKHIDMLARSPRSNATTLEYLVQCRDEIMRNREEKRRIVATDGNTRITQTG